MLEPDLAGCTLKTVVAIFIAAQGSGERGHSNAATWQNQGKFYQEMGDLSPLSQDTYCSCNTEGAVAAF